MIIIGQDRLHGELRYGPLSQEAAESLLIQLAVSGAYTTVEMIASDDINTEAAVTRTP